MRFERKITVTEQISGCFSDMVRELGIAEICPDKLYGIRLALSELAANVLTHGVGACLVKAVLTGDDLQMEVSGGNGFVPKIHRADVLAGHGRGMFLVRGMCSSYAYRDDGRTAVCTISLDAAMESKLKTAYERIVHAIGDATLVAATKTVSPCKLRVAEELGIKIFGENRVQELLEKYAYFPHIEWHFIGHLQTNKVKYIVDKVSLIHSVDSIKLLDEIQIQAAKIGKVQDVLLEVNPAREASKSGFMPEETQSAAEYAEQLANVRVVGLMAMVPKEKNVENNAKYYLQMRAKYDIMKERYHFTYLSMGMSDDFEFAVKSGSNMVRIGSGLFGERQTIKSEE